MGGSHAEKWSREGFSDLFGEAEAVSRVAEDEACPGDKEVGLVAVCERRQCCGGRQADAEKSGCWETATQGRRKHLVQPNYVVIPVSISHILHASCISHLLHTPINSSQDHIFSPRSPLHRHHSIHATLLDLGAALLVVVCRKS